MATIAANNSLEASQYGLDTRFGAEYLVYFEVYRVKTLMPTFSMQGHLENVLHL